MNIEADALAAIFNVIRWIERQEWAAWDGVEAEERIKAEFMRRGYRESNADQLALATMAEFISGR